MANDYIGNMLAIQKTAGESQDTGWAGFNQNLQSIGQSLGEYIRTERKRKQDMDDALMMVTMKAQAEQLAKQADPMYKIYTGIAEKFLSKPSGTTGTGETIQPEDDITFMPTIGKEGITFRGEFSPEAQRKQKVQETKEIQAAKPLSDVEAGIVSKSELLTPQIDKLISLLEQNKVYEGVKVPFGASRIAAFGEKGPWQAIKRGLTAGKGREAGLLLQELKVLAFGEGGKNLTENEKQTAMANINPAYKTEKQWIEGLKRAKLLLQRKAELVSKGIGNNGNIKQSQESDKLNSLKSKYGLE